MHHGLWDPWKSWNSSLVDPGGRTYLPLSAVDGDTSKHLSHPPYLGPILPFLFPPQGEYWQKSVLKIIYGSV